MSLPLVSDGIGSEGVVPKVLVSGPRKLDEKGRCCGRKPLIYKKPDFHYFCWKCNREFGKDGIQRSNWAFEIATPTDGLVG